MGDTRGKSGVMLAVGGVFGMFVGLHLYIPAHAGSDPCKAPVRVDGHVLFTAKGGTAWMNKSLIPNRLLPAALSPSRIRSLLLRV